MYIYIYIYIHIKDTPQKVIECFTQAVLTVDPIKAEGRLWSLWAVLRADNNDNNGSSNSRSRTNINNFTSKNVCETMDNTVVVMVAVVALGGPQ